MHHVELAVGAGKVDGAARAIVLPDRTEERGERHTGEKVDGQLVECITQHKNKYKKH